MPGIINRPIIIFFFSILFFSSLSIFESINKRKNIDTIKAKVIYINNGEIHAKELLKFNKINLNKNEYLFFEDKKNYKILVNFNLEINDNDINKISFSHPYKCKKKNQDFYKCFIKINTNDFHFIFNEKLEEIKISNVNFKLLKIENDSEESKNKSIFEITLLFLFFSILSIFFRPFLIDKKVLILISLFFIFLISIKFFINLILILFYFLILNFLLFKNKINIISNFILIIPSIIFFKMNFINENINFNNYIVFFGFGFFILKQIDIAKNIYLKNIKSFKVVNMILYFIYFPSLLSGPMIEYENFNIKKIKNLRDRLKTYFLKFLSSNFKLLFSFFILMYLNHYENLILFQDGNIFQYYIYFFFSIFFVYLNLSGYTEISRITSNNFGINLPKNFRNPFLQVSMRNFWKGWHISVSKWIISNLSFYILVVFRNFPALYLKFFSIFIPLYFIGIWHGLELKWIFWSIHHVVGIIIFDILNNKFLFRFPLAKKILLILCLSYWLALSQSLIFYDDYTLSISNYFMLLGIAYN